MIKFLDLHRQYVSIKDEIDTAIADVIRDAAFVSGRYAAKFEGEFAAYQNAAHCIGCGNGTDAIEIALEALQIPPGSEVIVPANTFIATSEAVTRTGHKVVFCDCDPDDYTISVASMVQKITHRTRAVVVVHLYGQPCAMDQVLETAASHGLKVVEDCAQAHGADFMGRRVGALGHIGTFSFYPGKNLGAYGDAGAVVTNDPELARRVRMIANHGRTAKYDHAFEGRNSRLDGLQAAILSVKLRHLDEWLDRRISIAEFYHEALAGVGDLVLPTRRNWSKHAYHLFVVRTERRDAIKKFLEAQGIETGIHYPIALPKLEAYRHLDQANEPFFANRSDARLLSLPIGDHMSNEDATRVASAVRDFFRHH
ncbi:MAG: DegT/DnrJ/EryC1/StrS family aminotransferase [Alphaproteobacteria bacterium]|nr:DegT/DnrJ/EryC1/StrS family aminotransferase [Alphaproteobacteria bacterium]MBL7099798.1 DegT/DnrJ/EryC1/StrS family aminotransferase [Alphaproteobacteria bacterium]